MNAHFLSWGLALWLAAPAAVQADADSELRFEQPWIRAAPATASVMAGYVRIVNPGPDPVRIVTLHSPQFARVEAHSMREVDGVMRMRPLQLDVPAGEALELAPGGDHLMLMQPPAPLASGARATLEFTLDDGRRQRVEFEVRTDAPAH